jgi:[protein-PII] uridylyltransferase
VEREADLSGAPMRAARDALCSQILAGTLDPAEFPPRFTTAADEYLTGLLSAAAGRPDPPRITLIAIGGYGRRELCPGSDLDVLLLHDKVRRISEVANAIWYRVWDSGMRLDHSVRTVKETLSVARGDLRAAAGLLDARVIAGDRKLGEELLRKVTELWRAHHRELLESLAEASRERHASFGALPYLLEPDLKESAGGLRDLESMRLAAEALGATPAVATLISPEPLEAAHRLLLRSRVALQARTGTSSDRLLLQEQDEVAAMLGYSDADAYAVDLAAASREVMWAAEDGWRRVLSTLQGPPGRGAGREVEVARGVVLRDGEIALAPGADPSTDPAIVLRVAIAAAEHEVPIDRHCLEHLARDRPELAVPWPAEMRDDFVSLLEHGAAAIPVIEMLDRARLFEWLLPEWTVVRHKPQRNAYHRFTIDRHLLEAVAEAVGLLRDVERPDLLLMATLLHDIGKGRPGDHSEVGRELAAGIMRRMGYPPKDVSVIERIVKRHLLLADTATRRDIDDPETIELVAEALGDVLTLELLAAVTEADSIATGQAAWGAWKASLVRALVKNVRAFLAGESVDSSSTRQVSPRIAALVEAGQLAIDVDGTTVTVVAPDRPGLFALIAATFATNRLNIRQAVVLGVKTASIDMVVDVFEVERDPDTEIDEQRLLRDLGAALAGELPIEERLRSVEEAYARYRRPAAAHSPAVVVLIDVAAGTSAAVVEVRAPDSNGLLHRLASVLTSAGLDVVSARIATLGHEVVDSFYVQEQSTGGRPTAERLEELRPALVGAVEGTHDASRTGP